MCLPTLRVLAPSAIVCGSSVLRDHVPGREGPDEVVGHGGLDPPHGCRVADSAQSSTIPALRPPPPTGTRIASNAAWLRADVRAASLARFAAPPQLIVASSRPRLAFPANHERVIVGARDVGLWMWPRPVGDSRLPADDSGVDEIAVAP